MCARRTKSPAAYAGVFFKERTQQHISLSSSDSSVETPLERERERESSVFFRAPFQLRAPHARRPTVARVRDDVCVAGKFARARSPYARGGSCEARTQTPTQERFVKIIPRENSRLERDRGPPLATADAGSLPAVATRGEQDDLCVFPFSHARNTRPFRARARQTSGAARAPRRPRRRRTAAR